MAAAPEQGAGQLDQADIVGRLPVAAHQDGTVFVIIEDETGDVQLVLWHRAFRENRRQLGSRVILAKGTVSRWYGIVSVAVSGVQGIRHGLPCPRPTTGR